MPKKVEHDVLDCIIEHKSACAKHFEEKDMPYIKYNTTGTYATSAKLRISDSDLVEYMNSSTVKKKSRKPNRKSEKVKFKSDLLQKMHKEIKSPNGSEISIALFTNMASDIYEDEPTLNRLGIYVSSYRGIFPDAEKYSHAPPSVPVQKFNMSIITGILEFLHNPMDAANLIRTALNSLRQDIKSPKLILTALSRREVQRKSMAEGCMPFSVGYIKQTKDSKLFVRGYTEGELRALLGFAGARTIWKPRCASKLNCLCLFANMKE